MINGPEVNTSVLDRRKDVLQFLQSFQAQASKPLQESDKFNHVSNPLYNLHRHLFIFLRVQGKWCNLTPSTFLLRKFSIDSSYFFNPLEDPGFVIWIRRFVKPSACPFLLLARMTTQRNVEVSPAFVSIRSPGSYLPIKVQVDSPKPSS